MSGEGSVYQRKDGRWVAQYMDTTGKARYIYRKNKKDAKQALREALSERDKGAIPVGKQTVADALDTWLEELQGTVSKRTYLNRECTVRVHLKPYFGTKRVAKLTSEDIRGFYRSKLAEGLASSYIKRMHIILKQALPAKYMAGIKPPREPQQDMEVLTNEQVLHLLDTVRDDRFECVYVLGALCGLRIGECLALRWSDIDVEAGTLQVQRTLWNGQTSQAKTSSSRRCISLPQRASEALVRLRNTSNGFTSTYPHTHSKARSRSQFSRSILEEAYPSGRDAGDSDVSSVEALCCESAA